MNKDFFNLFIRNLNRTDLKNIISIHASNSHIAFPEYKKQKLNEIKETLSIKKKIYLDTRFWNEFRNSIYQKKKSKPLFYEIFQILKFLVEEGKIICPYSSSLFDELLKQKDVNSRRRSAQIADALNNSYVLNPIHYIMSCELLNLIAAFKNIPLPKENYVWSNAINIGGDLDFIIDGEEDNEETILMHKKMYYDILMKMTLQEIVSFYDTTSESTVIAGLHSLLISNLLKGSKNTNVSHDELHKIELLSSYKSISECLKLPAFNYNNIISNTGIDKLKVITPTIYVYAAIFSHFERNYTRTMKENDYYDISHSCLAVAHCDYFFTEKSFCSLLKSDLKLEHKFQVKIEHQPQSIIKTLQLI